MTGWHITLFVATSLAGFLAISCAADGKARESRTMECARECAPYSWVANADCFSPRCWCFSTPLPLEVRP